MPRAKGERLLAELIARAEAYNADPDGLAWVDVIELDGSLADEPRGSVGDVDVHVIASHRLDFETYQARCYEIGGSNVLDILSAQDDQDATR
jgi:hypothetical protein